MAGRLSVFRWGLPVTFIILRKAEKTPLGSQESVGGRGRCVTKCLWTHDYNQRETCQVKRRKKPEHEQGRPQKIRSTRYSDCSDNRLETPTKLLFGISLIRYILSSPLLTFSISLCGPQGTSSTFVLFLFISTVKLSGVVSVRKFKRSNSLFKANHFSIECGDTPVRHL